MNVKIKENQTHGMWYSNLENEVLEIEEQDAFKLKDHNLFILKSDCDIVSQTIESESVTVQNTTTERKQIGTYEGVEIYEDTKAWFVDIKHLRVVDIGGVKLEHWYRESIFCSKVYLSAKEANARLRKEVGKVAKNRKFTLEELKHFDKHEYTAIGFTIELVEKEHNVVYLNEGE